ncbi:class I SAM-dependent methyltransferase, partial [Streptomyces sp. NPDC127091]|uniref:class I SAM-dependent methyltransferase n=1 Tax=Streptomyces sp. NPDC127091 TaxID=3347134 RepID=UPI0036628E5C
GRRGARERGRPAPRAGGGPRVSRRGAWGVSSRRAPARPPPTRERRHDVVLVRHVLWTLPDPARVLRHWRGLLRPGGRLVLVEGVWGTVSPVGIPVDRLTSLLAPFAGHLRVERLSDETALWGREVGDERYVVVATPE